jgi:predicted nucleotide-binding protein
LPTRRTAPPQPRTANLTVEQMRRGIGRLKLRITDLEAFDPQSVQQRWAPEVKALQTSIEQTLAAVFGHNTVDYNRYRAVARLDDGPIDATPDFLAVRNSGLGWGSENVDFRRYLAEGKQQAILLLKEAARGLEEEIADRGGSAEAPIIAAPALDLSKVFVVHGHDNEVKNDVARFLERIGLEAIILHERPNLGRHLLTKFQEEAEGVGFAVVLITPDDEGALAGEPLRKRARQNVVFELGFLIGKLGPAHVAALVKGEIERPSDFDGVGYIELDPAGGWKGLLARELRGARLPFDPMKVLEA